ncbi:acyl-CoA dehydrogenase family protein [Rummeliibacillus sp. JY-2-4R]
MDFAYSNKVVTLQEKLTTFMEEYVYPNEAVYAEQLQQENGFISIPPIIEELKSKAKEQGLWNLFLPNGEYGVGLTNLEYAPLCEIMGRSLIAPEIFNCNAPDSGIMEILVRYGTEQQKKHWLEPLLKAKIRSCFAMTEPDVTSSELTNLEASIERDGDEYVLNGRKSWTTGGSNPLCKIAIFTAKHKETDAPLHEQLSMILVPMDTPGIKIEKMQSVFGYDHAPEGYAEVTFNNVRVPVENMIWGEGKGFTIAQRYLAQERIHHSMRLIGAAERALEDMCIRVQERTTLNHTLSKQGVIRERIAESRIEIEQARLLTLKAAYMMDTVGNKESKADIAMIKVTAPNVAIRVIDRAIQAFGVAGVSSDFTLAAHWANSRTIRLADGPDELHRNQIAKIELKKHQSKVNTGERV